MAPHHFEVPTFKIVLTGVEHTLVQLIEDRMGELKAAAQEGIRLAMQVLPTVVAERCRVAMLEAMEEATENALEEYFSPGGEGYEAVMKHVKEFVTGQGQEQVKITLGPILKDPSKEP